jgi:hypothetical protein
VAEPEVVMGRMIVGFTLQSLSKMVSRLGKIRSIR